MPFSSLPGLPTSTQDRSILAQEHNLTNEQFETLAVIQLWKQLLTEQIPENRDALKTLVRSFGYLRDSAFPNIANTEAQISNFTLAISDAVLLKNLSLNAIRALPDQAFISEYGNVEKAQLKLLRNLASQQVELDRLELGTLPEVFPLPITQFNYFGRFIATGTESPENSIRHLQISAPFFIRIRALIEQMVCKNGCYFAVDFYSFREKEEALQRGNKKSLAPLPDSVATSLRRVVETSISRAGDLASGLIPLSQLNFAYIEIPINYFPQNIETTHIDHRRNTELSIAIVNWILFGNKDAPILHSKELNRSDRKALAKLTQRLAAIDHESNNHVSKKPSETEVVQYEKWKRLHDKYLRLYNSTAKKIADLNEKKENLKSVAEQLELDSNALGRSKLAEFRKSVASAIELDQRIVFSTLSTYYFQRPDLFFSYCNAVINTKRMDSDPAVRVLKSSRFIITHNQLATLHQSSDDPTHNDVEYTQFDFNSDEFNASVKFVSANLLPKVANPKINMLIDCFMATCKIPGVQEPDHLRLLVKAITTKNNPTISDYLVKVFEYSATMSQENFLSILDVTRSLGVIDLPERCQALAVNRFGLDPKMLQLYSEYSRSYKPRTVGTLPEIFTDLGRFETYLSYGLDSYGMRPEVLQLQEALLHHPIVTIVDGTSYHPELNTTIEATGTKLEKGDVEKTTEVWGDYIQPPERLIRGFTRQLLEGGVDPALRDYSVVTIVKPTKEAQVVQSIVKKFYGLDIDISPDLSKINTLLADLTIFNSKTILIIETGAITNLEQYRQFIDLLSKYKLKIIIRTREALPGLPQVNIQPFLESGITARLSQESGTLSTRLGLSERLSDEVVEFATRQVMNTRRPGDDPLNLVLQVLSSASSNARLFSDKKVCRQDVTSAMPAIFHLPDSRQMSLKIKAIDDFAKRAPFEVLGQAKAISKIANLMKSHILGLRDNTRPLTILIPGPTGVGKTELMCKFANICDLPFFGIEGAEYSEEHTISRLVGSPTGYKGTDEGILYTFAQDNSTGLVFIDEIEKMHPAVWQSLMNFYDKGTVTGGHGKSVSRPGLIVVGASNAGADELRSDLEESEVRRILAEAFVDSLGRPRPELVRRFEPIMMLAIEEADFKEVIRKNLESIGERKGFVNANLLLTAIDDTAIGLIFKVARDVCEFDEEAFKGARRMGLPIPNENTDGSNLYYDMRHVSRALDHLAGPSIQQLVLEQIATGRQLIRGVPREVKIVGDLANQRVLVIDAAK